MNKSDKIREYFRKHPEADKIQLVDVDLGDGEALQI